MRRKLGSACFCTMSGPRFFCFFRFKQGGFEGIFVAKCPESGCAVPRPLSSSPTFQGQALNLHRMQLLEMAVLTRQQFGLGSLLDDGAIPENQDAIDAAHR